MEGKNNFEADKKQESEKSYYEKRDRQARDILIQAASFCEEKEQALDLGAGDLAESRFLLKNGFKNVIAVDKSSQSEKVAKEINLPGIDFRMESFNHFEFESNKYNLINAQFSLPFYNGDNFSDFMKKLIDSLKPRGIFTGHLFGINHDRYWGKNNDKKIIHTTKEEIDSMFQGLEKIEFRETEKDGSLHSEGFNHWHVFSFIVKKKDLSKNK